MAEPTAPCPDDHALVALALGHLTGRERADVLGHVTGCRACRSRTEELIQVSERLALVAPEAEPPAGFEAAVLGRLDVERPLPRRASRRAPLAWAAVVAVVALAGAALLGALWRPTASAPVERAAMATPAGRDVGAVWHYDGDPAWVFLAVPGWEVWEPQATGADSAGSTYTLRGEMDDGRVVVLGTVAFSGPDGTWATTTDIDTSRLRTVAIVDETGRVWCRGRF